MGTDNAVNQTNGIATTTGKAKLHNGVVANTVVERGEMHLRGYVANSTSKNGFLTNGSEMNDHAACSCTHCTLAIEEDGDAKLIVAESQTLQRNGDETGSTSALIMTTGSNAAEVAQTVSAMSEEWGIHKPMIQLVDYATTQEATEDTTLMSMREQLDAACVELAIAQDSKHQLRSDALLPVWLLLDLIDPSPGLSAGGAEVGYRSTDAEQSMGMSGLNWLEQLEVFVWQRLRRQVAPQILLLAQPSQREEITQCLRQLSSFRDVPFYIAGPLDRAGHALKPSIWHAQLATAVVGIMYGSDAFYRYPKTKLTESTTLGETWLNSENRSVYALGGTAQFAPFESIQEWLAIRTVQSLVASFSNRQEPISRVPLESYPSDSKKTIEVTHGASDIAVEEVVTKLRARSIVDVHEPEAADINLIDAPLGNFDIVDIPDLATDLVKRENEILSSIPNGNLVDLVDRWQYGYHQRERPSQDLLMEVQQEQLPLAHQQYGARRTWLRTQLSMWERELYSWTDSLVSNAGQGTNITTYENGLRTIWHSLMQIATDIEEKLEKAGNEVRSSEQRLYDAMAEVDATCYHWVEAATRRGIWRFMRPDYGWLWIRKRFFVLPRKIRALSVAFETYKDAQLREANLHVLRQVSLAKMQDVRAHLSHAEALTVWFNDFQIFLARRQQEIEASMGGPWNHKHLNQLWQAMQSSELRCGQTRQLEAFLEHKPLTAWLRELPAEIYSELAEWVDLKPPAMHEPNVLDILIQAVADPVDFSSTADWLTTFAGDAKPLWPSEYLANEEGFERSILTLQPGLQPQSQSLKLVGEWCNEQPNIEHLYSGIDGVLVVAKASTDLEALWL